MADVFISYASEDRSLVQPLVKSVEAQGYSVWWDRDIDPGANFEDVIEAQLTSARIVVVVWSANSVRSSWVHSEAMEGLERGVLVPVILERARLPLAFRHINTVDLHGWNGSSESPELNRFTQVLAKLMAGETLSVDPVPEPRASRTRSRQRYIIPGVLVMLLLVLAVAYFYRGTTPAESEKLPRNSIAVLDFENTGGVETAYIASGISDQIRDLLTRSNVVQVASRTLGAATLTSASRWGPAYFLEGSSLTRGQTLQVDVHLVDGYDGFRIWSQHFSMPRSQILDASVDIVHAVLQQMDIPIPTDSNRFLEFRPTASVEAFDKYLLGAELLKSSQMEESLDAAERAFSEAIRQDPGFAMPYAGLCRTHQLRYRRSMNVDWFKSARDHCQRALAHDAFQTQAQSALGNLYLISGDYDAAVEAFRAGINLSPNDPEIASGLANGFSFTGQRDRAEQWFRRAIFMDPSFWRSYMSLGAFFFRLGEYDQAISAYRDLVKVKPDYAPGWADLSAAYQLNGDLEDAVTAAQASLDLERTAQALSNTATALYFVGRFEDARSMYQQAIELTPENHIPRGNLGEVELLLGHTVSAMSTFNKAIDLARTNLQINPANVVTLGRLASYGAAAQMKREEVETLLARAYRLQPEDPYLHYDAALAHLRLGDEQAAARDLEKALASGYPEILARADPQLAAITDLPTRAR
ncbi:MAG: TIR domain-containing protein [Gammaproteobacteria bacterium]|nr:TIR domain-containing protein [Gammaproteobacteria bacterium]